MEEKKEKTPPICIIVIGMAGSGKTAFVQVWEEFIDYVS